MLSYQQLNPAVKVKVEVRTKLSPKCLCDDEIAFIGNGCSPAWLTERMPTWLRKIQSKLIHTKQCQHHDCYYYRGAYALDRVQADDFFYKEMKENAGKQPWYKKPLYYVGAWTRYQLVQTWGETAFHYAPRKRSYEDLQKDMHKAKYSLDILAEYKQQYLKELKIYEATKGSKKWN